MRRTLAVLFAPLLSTVSLASAVMAQPACGTFNGLVPAAANTTDRSQPFFIDTTGLDLRTAPPRRDPSNPSYPRATELPDGTLPPAGAEGNFIIGPTHAPAPETVAKDGVPRGTVTSFTLSSKGSVIYDPGLIRDDPPDCPNGSVYRSPTVTGDPSSLIVSTSHPGTWTRRVAVYVPATYERGTEAPFIVLGDGGMPPYKDLVAILDNLIEQRRVPPLVAIEIASGGQDAQGSERGREYDTVSGAYAEWVEREVLPQVERQAGVRLTRNPEGRAALGISSSGAAAFTMAWFHPELYRRVLAYSPTLVNQQWPHAPWLRGGAWEYHSAWTGPPGPNLNIEAGVLSPSAPPGSPLIPANPPKPIRFWYEIGDQDLFYPNAVMADGMHDWVLAAERMAKVLADNGYHYQFVFARNANHGDRAVKEQTLPEALEYLWQGYSAGSTTLPAKR